MDVTESVWEGKEACVFSALGTLYVLLSSYYNPMRYSYFIDVETEAQRV